MRVFVGRVLRGGVFDDTAVATRAAAVSGVKGGGGVAEDRGRREARAGSVGLTDRILGRQGRGDSVITDQGSLQ